MFPLGNRQGPDVHQVIDVDADVLPRLALGGHVIEPDDSEYD